MVKSTLKKAAGRKQFRSNPVLKGWARSTSPAWADYKADKIAGFKYSATRKAKDVMRSQKYKDHRRKYANKFILEEKRKMGK
jgi:hypothetical protein